MPYQYLNVKCKFANEIVKAKEYNVCLPIIKDRRYQMYSFHNSPNPGETYEDWLNGKEIVVNVEHGKKNCYKYCEKNDDLGLDDFDAIVNKCEIKRINVNSLLYGYYLKKETSETYGVPYRTDPMLIETIRIIKEELIKLRENLKYEPIYEKDKCHIFNISYKSGSANYCHVSFDDDEVEDENSYQGSISRINQVH